MKFGVLHMKHELQRVVDAKLENLSKIADFIHKSLVEFGVDEKIGYQIQTAVDEACTNIMMYAYPQKNGKMVISCIKEGKQVMIIIEDWGKSWDPNTVQKPDLNSDLHERKIGGLGIHIIKTFMDQVTYQRESEKNILTMTKII